MRGFKLILIILTIQYSFNARVFYDSDHDPSRKH